MQETARHEHAHDIRVLLLDHRLTGGCLRLRDHSRLV
jgi:hypothetical protein